MAKVSSGQALAVQVISQALADARSQVNWQLTVKHIDNARQFCTAADGPWAVARERWCDAAGILPDAFRAHALAVIGLPYRRTAVQPAHRKARVGAAA